MTEGENMLERCARAAWAERVRFAKEANGIDLEAYDETTGFVPAGDRFSTVAEMNNIRGEIRAVIEALMTPTPEMLKVGAASVNWNRGVINKARGCYVEMLRTASIPNEEGEGK